jgi:hypothetical protein
MNQSHTNLEVHIIWDDAGYGYAATANKGLCTWVEAGNMPEYILFMADDVVLYPSCISKMVEALNKHQDRSLAYCNWLRSYKGAASAMVKAAPWSIGRLRSGNYISGISMIRAKDMVLFDESLKRLVDWDMWLTMAEKGLKGVWIDEVLFETWHDNNGISSKGDYEQWEKKVKEKHNIS